MAAKTANILARVEPDVKLEAEKNYGTIRSTCLCCNQYVI